MNYMISGWVSIEFNQRWSSSNKSSRGDLTLESWHCKICLVSSFSQSQSGQLKYILCFLLHITTPVGTTSLTYLVIHIFSCNRDSLRALPRTSQCIIFCKWWVKIFSFFKILWSTLERRIDLYSILSTGGYPYLVTLYCVKAQGSLFGLIYCSIRYLW